MLGKSGDKVGFWVETISDLPGPRIYILHNVVSKEEAAHLKSLGIIKGMEKALIIPYGGKDLIESSTRTNTAAWLDFAQDEVVRKVERAFADFTGTDPENGENLQVRACKRSRGLLFSPASPLCSKLASSDSSVWARRERARRDQRVSRRGQSQAQRLQPPNRRQQPAGPRALSPAPPAPA